MNIPNIPTLDTDRLRLRAFVPADLDAYAAMSADAEVMRYIGDGGPVSRDVAWRQMAFFLGHWPLLGYGMWAIERRADAVLVGRAGFINPPGWPGLEIGWLLARGEWGAGYAFEAAKAALAWGRAERGMKGVISLIREGNVRSESLALKLGARREGEAQLGSGPANVFRHAN